MPSSLSRRQQSQIARVLQVEVARPSERYRQPVRHPARDIQQHQASCGEDHTARSPAIGTEGSIAEAVRPGIRVLPYPWSGTVVLAFGPGRKSRRRGQNAPAPDTVWCRTIASSRCPKHRSHWFPIPGGIMNIDVAVPSERTVGRALAVRQLLQLVLGNGTGEQSAMDPPAGCKTTCLPPPGVPGPDGNWR